MHSLPPFSLAHLTVLDLAPPQMIELAARLGYEHVGIRILPTISGSIAYPLMNEPELLRETLARIADTGVSVFDIEIVRFEVDFEASHLLPFLEVGATLGAKAILAAGLDPEESRLTTAYASLCEAAAQFGLTVDLEFMPWTKVPDLATALRVVAGAAQPNGGILVDPLHFSRSSSTLTDLAQVPSHCLHYLQICDAPAEKPKTIEEMIHTARFDRLLPGEGGIDLNAIVSLLPHHIPVSVEVPNANRMSLLGREEWVRQALAASKATLSAMPPYVKRAPALFC